MDRVYEDYEPYHEWDKDEGRFTFMIPGYRRDQLRVQVTSKPALKLKGERQIFGNRWRRFDVEFPIPPDYDLESVSAKFEGGRLHVKFSKLAKPKEETTTTNPKPKEETSRPNDEAEPSQKKVDQQSAKQEEGTPKGKEDKAESKSNGEVSEQRMLQKEKENVPSDEKEKSKTETEDSIEKVAKKENEPSDEKGKSKTETEDSIENVAKKEDEPSDEKGKSKTETEDGIENVAKKENEPSDQKGKSKTETEDSIENVAKKENEPSDENGKSKTETEDRIEKAEKKEDKTNNGITEKKEAATTKAPEAKDATKPMARFKTRLVDFGIGLGPSNQAYNDEELGSLDAGTIKRKRLVNCGLMTLLAVGLGLYAKTTFMHSHGGPKFEDL